MYVLILLVCQGLACMHFEVLSKHRTLAECEVQMEKHYASLEQGQGLMCIKEEITTSDLAR